MHFPARGVTWVISLASILAFIFRTLYDLCFKIGLLHAMPSHHEKNIFPGGPGVQMLQVQAHSYSLGRLVFVYNSFPLFPKGMCAQ